VFFFFAADFGNFAYNRTRLNASALNFWEDAKISMAMLWQSYPLFWMLLGLIIAVFFFRWIFRRMHWTVIVKTDGHGIPYKRKWFFIAGLLLLIFIYGSLTTSSLKWKKAFELNDNFKSYLSFKPTSEFLHNTTFSPATVQ
jgi:hypothetical protein